MCCHQIFENKKFVDIYQQCFVLSPQVNFPAKNIFTEGKGDEILNLFYFEWNLNASMLCDPIWMCNFITFSYGKIWSYRIRTGTKAPTGNKSYNRIRQSNIKFNKNNSSECFSTLCELVSFSLLQVVEICSRRTIKVWIGCRLDFGRTTRPHLKSKCSSQKFCC